VEPVFTEGVIFLCGHLVKKSSPHLQTSGYEQSQHLQGFEAHQILENFQMTTKRGSKLYFL